MSNDNGKNNNSNCNNENNYNNNDYNENQIFQSHKNMKTLKQNKKRSSKSNSYLLKREKGFRKPCFIETQISQIASVKNKV